MHQALGFDWAASLLLRWGATIRLSTYHFAFFTNNIWKFKNYKPSEMKRILLAILMIFCCATTIFAQIKPNGKAIIKVPALTCEPCKDKLEQYLFKAYGVTSVKANFRTQTITITWLTDRTTIEEIRAYINNNGFDADDEKAEENAAKKIPACCVPKAIVKLIAAVTPAAPVAAVAVPTKATIVIRDTLKPKVKKTVVKNKVAGGK